MRIIYKNTSAGIEWRIVQWHYPFKQNLNEWGSIWRIVQDINKLIKYLINKGEGSQEFDTFIALLRGIKNNSNLLDFYSREFIENIKEIIPDISDKYDKALLIETITESFYEEYGFIDVKYRDELFNEYIILLEQYATTIDNAVRCLNGFVYSGISINDVFIRIAKYENKNNAIKILSSLGMNQCPDNSCIPSKMAFEVEKAYRVLQRSKILSHFLVIVHPLISRYTDISYISFKFDYEGAYIDWPFSEKGSTARLIESKIIDKVEGDIFEELGALIHEADEEIVNSTKIAKLYIDFFKGKDPFDVIFTLPE